MRNNDKIIQVHAYMQAAMRSQMVYLLEAEAPPDVLRRWVEAYSAIESSIQQLGEEERREEILKLSYTLPDTLRHIQQRLDRLEKVEAMVNDLSRLAERSLE